MQTIKLKRFLVADRRTEAILSCRPSNSSDFGLQTVKLKQFWVADRQTQPILGCRPSSSSDFGLQFVNLKRCWWMFLNHLKRLDLTERIRMHRSRVSGVPNMLRYGLFYHLISPPFSLALGPPPPHTGTCAPCSHNEYFCNIAAPICWDCRPNV